MGVWTSQVSTKAMVPLCRQLATSYDAGIPIVRTMEMVGANYTDKKVRDVLGVVQDDVKGGHTLGDAMRHQNKHFPHIFIELISAGEKGGKIDVMLRDLADYYEDRLSMQREIRSMAWYPVSMLFLAFHIGTFAFSFLRAALASFKGRGDAIDFGEVIMGWARFIGAAWVVFFGVLAAVIILHRMGIFKWIWGWVATFVYPLAPVTRKFALARFFRSFSLLLGSGVDILNCIRNAALTAINPYIERDLMQAVPLVKEGHTLVEAFAATRYMTPTAREMVHVGEQSGELEAMCRKVSEVYMEEATHAARVAMKIASTLLVLAVTCAVGAFIIYFYVTLWGSLYEELGI
jgi:type IV pilus assembly protein PilC